MTVSVRGSTSERWDWVSPTIESSAPCAAGQVERSPYSAGLAVVAAAVGVFAETGAEATLEQPAIAQEMDAANSRRWART
jgi:hypothetical protein